MALSKKEKAAVAELLDQLRNPHKDDPLCALMQGRYLSNAFATGAEALAYIWKELLPYELQLWRGEDFTPRAEIHFLAEVWECTEQALIALNLSRARKKLQKLYVDRQADVFQRDRIMKLVWEEWTRAAEIIEREEQERPSRKKKKRPPPPKR